MNAIQDAIADLVRAASTDEVAANLLPHVALMRKTNRFGRSRKAQPQTPAPAPNPAPAPHA